MAPQREQPIDFIGIGAPKCGTTWLGACLAQHPQIGFASEKEVYYFSDSLARRYFNAPFRHHERGVAWYHEQFPHAHPNMRTSGEYCPDYMYAPESCDRIYHYRSDIKLIVALRHPVDMMYSLYWYYRNGLLGRLPDTFEAFLDLPFFKPLGGYVTYLAPYYDRFHHDQLYVILYDDILSQPGETLASLFRFLGVDPAFQPADLGEHVNSAQATRFDGLQQFGQRTYQYLSRFPSVAALVRSKAFEDVLLPLYARVNRVAKAYPPMQPETRAQLAAFYRPYNDQLQNLIGRDVSAWNIHRDPADSGRDHRSDSHLTSKPES